MQMAEKNTDTEWANRQTEKGKVLSGKTKKRKALSVLEFGQIKCEKPSQAVLEANPRHTESTEHRNRTFFGRLQHITGL